LIIAKQAFEKGLANTLRFFANLLNAPLVGVIKNGHFAPNKGRVSENWIIKELTSRVWGSILKKWHKEGDGPECLRGCNKKKSILKIRFNLCIIIL
jgi:hypothetical protein